MTQTERKVRPTATRLRQAVHELDRGRRTHREAWLGGSGLPKADHLIALTASSNEIFEAALRMTGRGTAVAAQDLAAARSHLAQAAAIVDRLVTGGSSPQNERKR